MSSSTRVPIYQYIGRQYASVFIKQPCALYTAFDKCFYNCDGEKSLYITFLIHKKNSLLCILSVHNQA